METKKSTGFRLSVMTLAIMNVTAVVSLRGLPSEAVYGLSSAFYYLFAAIVFLIPTALVAAELAAMFSDKQGGVFRWVGEAFGARTGFLAIWLQWIESTIWLPDGANIRRSIHRLYRYGSDARYGVGLEQVIHIGSGIGDLLDCNLHLATRTRLGRQDQ